MGVIFFESVPFFSSSKAYLQGEQNTEENASCLSSFLPHSIHPLIFDNSSSHESRKDLLVYMRRQKNTMSTSSPIISSKPGNIQSQPKSEDEHDLSIAFRKQKRSCTNYPISNFVSYKSLNPSYKTFMNLISSISIPSNLKEAISYSKCKEAMCEEMIALKKNGTWEVGNWLIFLQENSL